MNDRISLKQAAIPVFGADALTIEDVCRIARGASARLHDSPDYRAHIERGAAFIERLLASEGEIYGVTTGYGDSCSVGVAQQLARELPIHLMRFHGCGLGNHFTPEQTRAVLAARLASLVRGYSGVRWVLLERIAALLNHDLPPLMPAEGSVGASGDLTPLSYLAAVLMGEREVWKDGQPEASAVALAAAGIEPITLAPKEALAIMNGTAAMTGLACLAFERAEYLSRLATRISAMTSIATRGNPGHFDPALFGVKPHAGQNEVADWIWTDLGRLHDGPQMRLQDRYSIRCAPHVIGVLRDALPWMRRDIENELNSSNDNPIIDAVGERVLHGGHFYGGHIAFAMDALKNAVASIADLLDRQLALLVDTRYNHGLPKNLSGAEGLRGAINHGFKAVQIGTSSWTAEALKLTMPASSFSRSTECHNQDKVSMGTIAARDCLRVVELTEQVTAALLLAVTQGVTLRSRQGELDEATLTAPLRGFRDDIAKLSAFVTEDRPLEPDLRQILVHIRARRWELYS
ncbi:HAL/PAL/TAL family ammonia-lyase [Azoarcus taiwanensis]|uniref:tyrosine ammonia-lyase n=1 Tax=Azoarcus taiwanensis TaxID=666964 RepID=A0A972F898_9RHOO|nr:aromatic amino acid ammonia-lyase [Azoarcus taiwanensis]NMG03844.1 histidine ammonia-lyase [Azoarcus taiwanensis]